MTITQPEAFSLVFMGFLPGETSLAFSEVLLLAILDEAASNPKPIAFEPAELAEGLALNRKRCCPDGDESGIRSLISEDSPVGISSRNLLVRWSRAHKRISEAEPL